MAPGTGLGADLEPVAARRRTGGRRCRPLRGARTPTGTTSTGGVLGRGLRADVARRTQAVQDALPAPGPDGPHRAVFWRGLAGCQDALPCWARVQPGEHVHVPVRRRGTPPLPSLPRRAVDGLEEAPSYHLTRARAQRHALTACSRHAPGHRDAHGSREATTAAVRRRRRGRRTPCVARQSACATRMPSMRSTCPLPCERERSTRVRACG